jgi:hypothetical protein
MNSPQKTVPGTLFNPTGFVAKNSVADQSEGHAKKLCPPNLMSVYPLYFKALLLPSSSVHGRKQAIQKRMEIILYTLFTSIPVI